VRTCMHVCAFMNVLVTQISRLPLFSSYTYTFTMNTEEHTRMRAHTRTRSLTHASIRGQQGNWRRNAIRRSRSESLLSCHFYLQWQSDGIAQVCLCSCEWDVGVLVRFFVFTRMRCGCGCACVHACVHTCRYTIGHIPITSSQIYAYACKHICIHVCIHICIFIFISLCIKAYIFKYIHMYTYLYIYVYVHKATYMLHNVCIYMYRILCLPVGKTNVL